jgi:osmotically inducible lipoprotein OsmB
MRTRYFLAPAALALLLAGCGDTTTDRALSGGAIGAGAGAVGSTVLGGSTIGGAVLGGAAGAAAGALTDEDDIDLGRPIWRR